MHIHCISKSHVDVKLYTTFLLLLLLLLFYKAFSRSYDSHSFHLYITIYSNFGMIKLRSKTNIERQSCDLGLPLLWLTYLE